MARATRSWGSRASTRLGSSDQSHLHHHQRESVRVSPAARLKGNRNVRELEVVVPLVQRGADKGGLVWGRDSAVRGARWQPPERALRELD